MSESDWQSAFELFQILLLKRCKTEQNPQKSKTERCIPQKMRPHGKHSSSPDSCQSTRIGNDG